MAAINRRVQNRSGAQIQLIISQFWGSINQFVTECIDIICRIEYKFECTWSYT